jgi:hypothetical protein
VQELDGHGEGELHHVVLGVVEKDARHDVAGNLGVRGIEATLKYVE